MEIQIHKEVDARGLNCPLPILRAKKALADMESALPIVHRLHLATQLLSQTSWPKTKAEVEQGRAALQANYNVTRAIQTGTMLLPSPLPFGAQQQQALRDSAITGHTLAQLADGLGSTLGAAYVARAHESENGEVDSISPTMQHLIAYALMVSETDSKSDAISCSPSAANALPASRSSTSGTPTAKPGRSALPAAWIRRNWSRRRARGVANIDSPESEVHLLFQTSPRWQWRDSQVFGRQEEYHSAYENLPTSL